MGKGIAALAYLPKVDFIFPSGNDPVSINALKGVAFLVAQMQSEGTADGTYEDVIARGATPNFKSVWDITVADSGETFTCTFVSDDNPSGDSQGRAGMASRRKIDLIKLTSANNASVKSLIAAINFIEKLEDLVAKTGTGTTGDISAQTYSLRGSTPFESFEWTITKADNVYTLVTTANS